MNALNPLQYETLKLLKSNKSESVDVKELLVDYLSRRVIAAADKALEEQSLDEAAIESWPKQHHCFEA